MLEEDALPRAGGAEERDGLAVGHHEVHAVEHHLAAEPLADVPELDHVGSRILARTKSSTRRKTHETTTAVVVARPTPSAPSLAVYPT